LGGGEESEDEEDSGGEGVVEDVAAEAQRLVSGEGVSTMDISTGGEEELQQG
jgi:hypothetical protein